MGELKSAWQIALEKADKMGKLSPDELKKRNEEEYALIGKALAEKYLSGLDIWHLEVELGKYSGEEKEVVLGATVSRLIEAIELGNYELLEKACDGIFFISQNNRVRQVQVAVKKLFDECTGAEQKQREEIEKQGGETLRHLQISGSAIAAINPRVQDKWQQSLENLARPFLEELTQLKQELED